MNDAPECAGHSALAAWIVWAKKNIPTEVFEAYATGFEAGREAGKLEAIERIYADLNRGEANERG